MGILNFKNRKEKSLCRCCNSKSVKEKTNFGNTSPRDTAATACGDNTDTININVLGNGCKSCNRLYDNVKEAIENLNLKVKPEYIHDLVKISEYNIFSLPAIVINEKVVSAGKVLKTSDIEKLLNKYKNNPRD